MSDLLTFFVANSAAIVAILGLLFTSIEYISKTFKEKNFSKLVSLVLTDMTAAETLFTKGSDKKKWCLDRLQDHAREVGYPLDDEAITKISNLVDEICKTSKEIA